MPTCEMCGSDHPLFKTMIEGTEMNVCKACSKFGKVIKKIPIVQKEVKKEKTEVIRKKEPEKEIIQVISQYYANKIKTAREKKGLKQKEFAKKINEKESLIHKMEIGAFEPSINLARKIERFLHIRIVEQYEETKQELAKSGTEKFAIGDFVSIKKR